MYFRISGLKMLFVWAISVFTAFAQTPAGTWHAEVTHYPRTIFSAADTSIIVSRIESNPLHFQLFTGLYQTLSQPPSNRETIAKITKNAAFVYAINRKPENGSLVKLTEAERETLKNLVFQGFETADISVSSYTQYDQWHYRAREIISYCQAYDMLAGCNIPLDTLWNNGANRIHEYISKLYAQASNPQFNQFAYFANLRIIYSAALTMGAIVFNHVETADSTGQPANWAALGMNNIDRSFWDFQSSAESESGFAEGSYYLTYAMLYAIPTFASLERFLGDFSDDFLGRTIRNPWHNENYVLLMNTITKLKLPDGGLIPIEDAYLNADFPELAMLGNMPGTPQHFAWPLSAAIKSDLSNKLSGIYDLRADYIANAVDFSEVPENWQPTQFLPLAGSVVFRSSWDSTATLMHLTGKNGQARTANFFIPNGHNHADEGDFMIFAGGEMLALHPGYFDYPNNYQTKYSAQHNVILVDDAGPDSALQWNGNEQFLYGVDAFIKNTIRQRNSDFAEVRTRYQNSDIRRSVLFADREFFIIVDEMQSTEPRKFTFQLHGNGDDSIGTYLPNFAQHSAIWNAGEMRLKATVATVDSAAAFETARSKHAPKYQEWAHHSTLRVHQIAAKTNAVSALIPFRHSESEPQITLMPSSQNATGLQVLRNGQRYQMIAGTTDSLLTIDQLTGNLAHLATDGRLLFVRENPVDPTDFSVLYMDGKQVISERVNGSADTLFSSSDTTGVFAEFHGDTLFATILNPGKSANALRVNSIFLPLSVSGENITDWDYQPPYLSIFFDSSRANFTAIFSDDSSQTSIGNVGETLPTKIALLPNYPNPFNPSTIIRFQLTHASDVKLHIYNMLGQEIKTLLDAQQPAGEHRIIWNGQNENGEPGASGVYLLRMESGHFQQTRKLLLLR